jgi:PIN domain nuclease of toxin-antitoxin system
MPNVGRRSLSLGDRCVLAYALTGTLPVLTGDRRRVTLTAHGLDADVFTYQDAG